VVLQATATGDWVQQFAVLEFGDGIYYKPQLQSRELPIAALSHPQLGAAYKPNLDCRSS